MHHRPNGCLRATMTLAAAMLAHSTVWAAAETSCPPTSFTKVNFEQIEEGMTVEAVSGLLGCMSSPHLTIRKDYAISLYWAAVSGSLKYIQIWFDAEGQMVQRLHPAFEFKTSTGF